MEWGHLYAKIKKIPLHHSENAVEHMARNFCTHDWSIEYTEGHTQDARKKLTRRAVCKQCGLTQITEVTENHS